MNAGALARGPVIVERQFASLAEMPLDKGRTLQIRVNLTNNAAQAMHGVTQRERRLTVSTALLHGQTLRISIADSGVGIAAADLARVFAHGYTTRQHGHGFGLHSAAIAAREMRGTLTARSDGPGSGATFTLELPIDRVAQCA
jgi:C4-dicarboxylate-specific signal transduction histidine kinase